MWTKELPSKAGYYWVISKNDGLPAVIPVIVGELEKGKLGCMYAGQELELLENMKEQVSHWFGPVEAPELTEEIKAEVGELQEIA